MKRSYQLTIGSTLFAVTLIALVMSSTIWAALAAIELGMAWAIVKALSSNIPTALRAGMERNCFRSDGSFSANRQRIERLAIGNLEQQIYLALILILVPTNILLWYFYAEGLPLAQDNFLSDRENVERFDLRGFSIASGLGIYFLLAASLIGSAYWYGLRELKLSIAERAHLYWLRDIHGTPNASPFEFDPVEEHSRVAD